MAAKKLKTKYQYVYTLKDQPGYLAIFKRQLLGVFPTIGEAAVAINQAILITDSVKIPTNKIADEDFVSRYRTQEIASQVDKIYRDQDIDEIYHRPRFSTKSRIEMRS